MSASNVPRNRSGAWRQTALELGSAGSDAACWRARFNDWHGSVALGCLIGLVTLALAWPALVSPSPALLLVAGALIGVPHGTSDFVAGHRVAKGRLGLWWLPAFLAGYLAVASLVVAGWWFVPGPTLLMFLGVSALHFGAGEWDGRNRPNSLLRFAARALTPVLPIFLLRSSEVAGLLGLLGDVPSSKVEILLLQWRTGLLLPYLGLLAAITITAVQSRAAARLREATELWLLAAAAAVLPPFLTFAVYFCGLHAVRHLADVGVERHPTDGRAAFNLALHLVLPSALVCSVALASTWDAIAGALAGTSVLGAALRLVAALTVPHMLLEGWQAALSSAGRTPPG